MGRPLSGFWLPCLAFFVSLATIGAICTVTFRTVNLREYGVYDSKERVIYVTGVTVLASCVTAFILTQTRRLLIRYVDANIILTDGEILHTISGKWRTILGVGSIGEMWGNYRIVLAHVGIALITASIVASFTPTQGSTTIKHSVVVSSGEPYDKDWFCANQYREEELPPYGYGWNLTNGDKFWVNLGGMTCPTSRTFSLIQNVNGRTPQDYAYTDVGVAIKASAMGAPASVYSWPPGFDQNLRHLVTKFGRDLVKTTQCVPVMVRNPVSCVVGGELTVSNTNMTMAAIDGSCQISKSFFYDPRVNPTMANDMCAGRSVGQATAVFSATGRYAAMLALDMGDTTTFPWISNITQMNSEDNDARYAVTCTIDTRDVYEFRKVTLSLQTSSEVALQWLLAGEKERCDTAAALFPDDFTGQAAVTALSNVHAVLENQGVNGWIDSIHRSSNDGSDPNHPAPRKAFAFPSSKNGLEDVLGVSAAMVGAYMNSSRVVLPASAVLTNTRVGNGNPLTLIYTLPPIFAAILLGYLLWKTATLPHVETSTINLEKLVSFQYTVVRDAARPPSKDYSRFSTPLPVYQPMAMHPQ